MNDPHCISSRQNPAVKLLRALAADPRRQGRALLDGIHLVTTCLARGIAVRQLLVSESGQQTPEVLALLQRAGKCERVILRDSLFREISGVSTPSISNVTIDCFTCGESFKLPDKVQY